MGATTGWPRKVATGAGGIKTLEANIATMANGSTNFRGNAILTYSLIDLFQPSLANRYTAPVSGRFRQGPKTVSLRAEIIHHVAAAKADRGFKNTRKPSAPKRWISSVGNASGTPIQRLPLMSDRRNHMPEPAASSSRLRMPATTSPSFRNPSIARRSGKTRWKP